MNRDLTHLRQEYRADTLMEDTAEHDPIDQFAEWWDLATHADILEPNAMVLSTVSADGVPSARTVLLKGFDREGFVFYTNYESQKAREISANPHVSLVFLWAEMEKQVRISGVATRLSQEESAAYFHSRPRGSQLGAWTSPQSQVIKDRSELDERLREVTDRFADDEIALPDFWGGYRVEPRQIEFWQGRPSRLHDRLRYTLEGSAWRFDRLAP